MIISTQAQFNEEANKGTSFFTFAPDFSILEINTLPISGEGHWTEFCEDCEEWDPWG